MASHCGHVTLEPCRGARAASQQELRLHLELELPAWVLLSLTLDDLRGSPRQDSSTSHRRRACWLYPEPGHLWALPHFPTSITSRSSWSEQSGMDCVSRCGELGLCRTGRKAGSLSTTHHPLRLRPMSSVFEEILLLQACSSKFLRPLWCSVSSAGDEPKAELL